MSAGIDSLHPFAETNVTSVVSAELPAPWTATAVPNTTLMSCVTTRLKALSAKADCVKLYV